MRGASGKTKKRHKLTLMGCRGERSGFWPFSFIFRPGVVMAAVILLIPEVIVIDVTGH